MHVSVELIVWLVFVVCGIVTSSLSLRKAILVVEAVHARGSDQRVIDDAHHISFNQSLLVIGWFAFGAVGILGAISPPPDPPPPLTPLGMLLVWCLVGAVAVLSVMTVGDYLYTRNLWKRPSLHTPTIDSENQPTVVSELDDIALTAHDTNERVRNVEEAIGLGDKNRGDNDG